MTTNFKSVLGAAALSAALCGSAAMADPFHKGADSSATMIKVFFGDNLALGHNIAATFHPVASMFDKGYVILNADAQQRRELDRFGIRYELDHDVRRFEDARIRKVLARRALTGEDIPLMPECFRTVADTFKTMDKLAKDYPDLVSLTVAGESWNKKNGKDNPHDMRVIVLTNKKITGDKPKLFITSAIHAREMTTAETATRFVEELLSGYGKDADATWILDHHEVHAMLQTNPDGRKLIEDNYQDYNLKMKRKNENANHICILGGRYEDRVRQGVDLNRNFAFRWGGEGASEKVCSDTFRGESAASEPETQAVQNYLKKLFKDNRGPGDTDKAPEDTQGMYIDVHSYSELVLYPWGDVKGGSPNEKGFRSIGQRLAFFNKYQPKNAVGLYPTTGTTADYGYGELGVASLIFELGTAFHQTCEDFESKVLHQNKAAFKYAAKIVRSPFITAHGPVISGLKAEKTASGYSISAVADDTPFYPGSEKNSPKVESQNIKDAEIYVGTPPWAGGSAIALQAKDGTFDTTKEDLTGTVAAISGDKPVIAYVRARDTDDRWGAFSAVFLKP